jgi:hypothetical protein
VATRPPREADVAAAILASDRRRAGYRFPAPRADAALRRKLPDYLAGIASMGLSVIAWSRIPIIGQPFSPIVSWQLFIISS